MSEKRARPWRSQIDGGSLRVQSVDLVSRNTQTSSRSLLILSGSVFLVMHYELNTTAWNIADRQLSPIEFKEIATIVLVFVAVAHLVNWLADHTAFTKWFQTNAIPTDSLDAIGSFRKSSQTMTVGLVERAKRLSELSESIDQQVTSPADLEPQGDWSAQDVYDDLNRQRSAVKSIEKYVADARRRIEEIESVLDDIRPGFKTVSLTAGFVVYVWYLAVPLMAFSVAIARLWGSF
ncbi:hypothetical protein [Aliiroseovarius sp. YM-037]|uniref:hypothetical protein n=1 Tax=Aliiroseovarius sp. YM-037 TaxID=3341728 RepID=UPI003A805D96